MNVLITGAAGGLGRAFALECAERGYNMLLTDINGAGLEQVKLGLSRQYGVKILSKPCDITNDADVKRLMVFALENAFTLDMLFNVAGLDFEGGFSQRAFNQISQILRVNIEATLRITHSALTARREGGHFYIIFVSSLASMYPIPLKATYAASKRFLLDFSIALGEELKSKNVSVLSLCPGGLPTTAEAMNGIIAQGFWGSATTNRLEKVVHNTICKALKGKKIYIPGALNKVFTAASKLVPPRIIAKLLYRRWNSAQKKWLDRETAKETA